MDATPNYGFNRRPRFSANHLAAYLCTEHASQRDAVIRRAKFPRKIDTAAYQQVVPTIRSFFTSKTRGPVHFASLRERLEARARRGDDGEDEDWGRLEAKRCIKAIDAFLATFDGVRWGKVEFQAGPQDVGMNVEGVALNARLDPPLIERTEDPDRIYAGGCVLFLANTAEARKDIDERRKYVAAIAHWALDETSTNVEPLGRLCMSFDIFGGEVTRAPVAFTRLRRTMVDSCREVAQKWDGIKPPPGYDGPPWQ